MTVFIQRWHCNQDWQWLDFQQLGLYMSVEYVVRFVMWMFASVKNCSCLPVFEGQGCFIAVVGTARGAAYALCHRQVFVYISLIDCCCLAAAERDRITTGAFL